MLSKESSWILIIDQLYEYVPLNKSGKEAAEDAIKDLTSYQAAGYKDEHEFYAFWVDVYAR